MRAAADDRRQQLADVLADVAAIERAQLALEIDRIASMLASHSPTPLKDKLPEHLRHLVREEEGIAHDVVAGMLGIPVPAEPAPTHQPR